MSARKGYDTVTVRLDEGEEEESEVKREALAGRGGGEKEKEEKRGREAGRRKWTKLGRGEGRKEKGMCPKCRRCGTRYEADSNAWGNIPLRRSLLRRTRMPGGISRAPEGSFPEKEKEGHHAC